jgi:hypothetical protein
MSGVGRNTQGKGGASANATKEEAAAPQYPGGREGMRAGANSTDAAPQISLPSRLDRREVKNLYLAVSKGVDIPVEAPEVYYRFTIRTLERYGGVPVNSTIYKAKIEKDSKKNTWRVDIYSPDFGTVEIFSRFTLGETRVYSQYTFLHYVRTERSKNEAETPPPMPPVADLPEDWPQIVFPVSNSNDMPIRSLRIGEKTNFTVKPGTERGEPVDALLFEKDHLTPLALPYDPKERTFSCTPLADETLDKTPRGTIKNVVLQVAFPNSSDVATVGIGVSKSRWSGLDLNSGLFLLFGSAGLTIVAVLRRRKRFKYHDRN